MLFLLFLARKPYRIPYEKMARKDVIKESVYHGINEMSIKYSLVIPVILDGSVESAKVSLSEKNPQ